MSEKLVSIEGYFILSADNDDSAFARVHKLLSLIIDQSPYEADFEITSVEDK